MVTPIKMPLYVCGTCSQHFTRRYNANRHNKNIHANRAEIARFLEYLIGRSIGKYLASDPLSYRSKRRSYNKDVIIHITPLNLPKATEIPILLIWEFKTTLFLILSIVTYSMTRKFKR
jgi:hypothetical protein